MNQIENLTLKEVINLAEAVKGGSTKSSGIAQDLIGKYVLIRTYSAGVWAGFLTERDGNEVILSNARRLWFWHAEKSISLSAVALYGAKKSKSKIVAPVSKIWLEAIEIIPFNSDAAASVQDAPYVEAE